MTATPKAPKERPPLKVAYDAGRDADVGQTSASAFIEVAGLSLRYFEQRAFEGVSLELLRGRITALVGPSGCGKTSFLSCLNRLSDLLPGCVVAGSVKVAGEEIFDPACDLVTLRRRVGMIFHKQNPFPFSVRKNFHFPLKEHGVRDARERERRMQQALADVGLWAEVKDRLDASALGLSGGQQQRLCIARALALEPEALLLDEPTSSLDPLSSGVVEDLIVSLKGRYTLVVVTHNLAQARRIADEVAVFWLKDGAGRLIEKGPAAEVFEAPKDELTRAYVQGARG